MDGGQYLADIMGNRDQSLIDAIEEEIVKVHNHYIDLVVNSKVAEMLGRLPTLEELKTRGEVRTYPDGETGYLFDGIGLIRHSVLEYGYENGSAVCEFQYHVTREDLSRFSPSNGLKETDWVSLRVEGRQ